MARRILYLLIEEQDRELRSRALVTAIAVERGFDVVLVPQWVVWQNWRDLPPGLILFKGNNAAQAVRMRETKQTGHCVASIEEEALGISDRAQLLRCYDDGVGENCDAFLVHGPFQADCVLGKFPNAAGRVHITGNPRIDLFQAKFAAGLRADSEALRRRFGDFLLINTNFSTINPRDDDALGCFDACVRVGLVDPGDPVDLEEFFTWCDWEKTNLATIGALLDGLRRRGFSWPVIVRPHPTEELNIWRRALDGDKHVRVIREGDHLAWTAAARLLVHPGCTTGLEALLLNTPALSLTVGDNPWHGMYLSNQVNPTRASVEDAIDVVMDYSVGEDRISPERARCLERLDHHIMAGADHLAAVAVVDVLERLPSPVVDAVAVARLDRLRSVLSGEGKIEPETFTPDLVGSIVNTMRTALGLSGAVRISEPAFQVLVCPAMNHTAGRR